MFRWNLTPRSISTNSALQTPQTTPGQVVSPSRLLQGRLYPSQNPFNPVVLRSLGVPVDSRIRAVLSLLQLTSVEEPLPEVVAHHQQRLTRRARRFDLPLLQHRSRQFAQLQWQLQLPPRTRAQLLLPAHKVRRARTDLKQMRTQQTVLWAFWVHHHACLRPVRR